MGMIKPTRKNKRMEWNEWNGGRTTATRWSLLWAWKTLFFPPLAHNTVNLSSLPTRLLQLLPLSCVSTVLREPLAPLFRWSVVFSQEPVYHEFHETCHLRYIDCTGQFTPKMNANTEPRLLSSLVWIDSGVVVSQHRLESFFMKWNVTEWQV